jgi:hypothetical protein
LRKTVSKCPRLITFLNNATLWAGASWRFSLRRGCSTRLTQIWVLRLRLEKQPTDLAEGFEQKEAKGVRGYRRQRSFGICLPFTSSRANNQRLSQPTVRCNREFPAAAQNCHNNQTLVSPFASFACFCSNCLETIPRPNASLSLEPRTVPTTKPVFSFVSFASFCANCFILTSFLHSPPHWNAV